MICWELRKKLGEVLMKRRLQKLSVLKKLLLCRQPLLTVNKIDSIAKECNLGYQDVLGFINYCRRCKNAEVHQCLFTIARKYRPDILNDVVKRKVKEILT